MSLQAVKITLLFNPDSKATVEEPISLSNVISEQIGVLFNKQHTKVYDELFNEIIDYDNLVGYEGLVSFVVITDSQAMFSFYDTNYDFVRPLKYSSELDRVSIIHARVLNDQEKIATLSPDMFSYNDQKYLSGCSSTPFAKQQRIFEVLDHEDQTKPKLRFVAFHAEELVKSLKHALVMCNNQMEYVIAYTCANHKLGAYGALIKVSSAFTLPYYERVAISANTSLIDTNCREKLVIPFHIHCNLQQTVPMDIYLHLVFNPLVEIRQEPRSKGVYTTSINYSNMDAEYMEQCVNSLNTNQLTTQEVIVATELYRSSPVSSGYDIIAPSLKGKNIMPSGHETFVCKLPLSGIGLQRSQDDCIIGRSRYNVQGLITQGKQLNETTEEGYFKISWSNPTRDVINFKDERCFQLVLPPSYYLDNPKAIRTANNLSKKENTVEETFILKRV